MSTNKSQILTHRWIEPLNDNFSFLESSKDAFQNQLDRGFWLEFDVNFSKDNVCFVFHDNTLKRISNWQDMRHFSEIDREEIKRLPFGQWQFTTLEELILSINQARVQWEFSALHIKHTFQKPIYIDIISETMNKVSSVLQDKLFIFDVTVESALYFKKKCKDILLFASVAHEYDRERYNKCVGNTLLSLETVLANKPLFNWVRLDERDRKDYQGSKKLYTDNLFRLCKKNWLYTAVVSPELHNTSPWLLWWEAHEDCASNQSLKTRINEIISYEPDFICTDYPQYYGK